MIDDVCKGADTVVGTAGIRCPGPFVEWDQVDLGWNTVNQLYQPMRIFITVIHPVQHDILKGDAFRIADFGISAQRL